ncbi:unnamed protein product [Durusdinium trenchii]|uniref:Peptidase A2 domain-containing protein n=1 Tax=Durusdinium trenchii TaxID=1381693 RepID=A0ABP0L203_9DINO
MDPPSTPSQSPVAGAQRRASEQREFPPDTAPTVTLGSGGGSGSNTLANFFEDELRGYRLMKAAKLSQSERQAVLVQTQNSTHYYAIRQALRTLYAEESERSQLHDRGRSAKAWWANGEWEPEQEELELDWNEWSPTSWDQWEDEPNSFWYDGWEEDEWGYDDSWWPNEEELNPIEESEIPEERGKSPKGKGGKAFFTELYVNVRWDEFPQRSRSSTRAVIDTGATETAVGISCLEEMVSSGHFVHEVSHDSLPVFRFANGHKSKALSNVVLRNTSLGALNFYVLGDLGATTPPLLGAKTLRAKRALLSYSNGLFLFAPEPSEPGTTCSGNIVNAVQMEALSSGHLTIDLASPPFQVESEIDLNVFWKLSEQLPPVSSTTTVQSLFVMHSPLKLSDRCQQLVNGMASSKAAAAIDDPRQSGFPCYGQHKGKTRQNQYATWVVCLKCGIRLEYQTKKAGHGGTRQMGPDPQIIRLALADIDKSMEASEVTMDVVNGKMMEIKGKMLQMGIPTPLQLNMTLDEYHQRLEKFGRMDGVPMTPNQGSIKCGPIEPERGSIKSGTQEGQPEEGRSARRPFGEGDQGDGNQGLSGRQEGEGAGCHEGQATDDSGWPGSGDDPLGGGRVGSPDGEGQGIWRSLKGLRERLTRLQSRGLGAGMGSESGSAAAEGSTAKTSLGLNPQQDASIHTNSTTCHHGNTACTTCSTSNTTHTTNLMAEPSHIPLWDTHGHPRRVGAQAQRHGPTTRARQAART